MVQTISNPDGTVSIIHVDPNNPVITLPDGTTAQVGRQVENPNIKTSYLRCSYMMQGPYTHWQR